MDENSGYVYALINPSLEGLVRIEVTKGDPHHGAKDLSIASGAAAPFIVIFQQWFKDCAAASEFVQSRLSEHISTEKAGYFRVSNTDAVLAILEAKSGIEPSEVQEISSGTGTLEDTAKTNRRKFCGHLLTEGRRFQYGDSSIPKNEDEAINLFKKAIDMNCPDANRLLGTLYYERSVFHTASELDLHEAVKRFEAGIAKGNTRCWGDEARCYEKLKDYRNAETCWWNFWSRMKDKMAELDENSQGLYASRFQEYMTSPARLEHRKLTLKVATRVGGTYDELPEGQNELQFQTLFGAEYPG